MLPPLIRVTTLYALYARRTLAIYAQRLFARHPTWSHSYAMRVAYYAILLICYAPALLLLIAIAAESRAFMLCAYYAKL